jgi:hypothetical protein
MSPGNGKEFVAGLRESHIQDFLASLQAFRYELQGQSSFACTGFSLN